jgi:hypothetical protein
MRKKGGIIFMNATRATAVTIDGGVFGATTETPPEDPPPDTKAAWAIGVHLLVHLTIHLAKIKHHYENNYEFNPQVVRIRVDADSFRDTQTPRSINYVEMIKSK